MRKRTKFNLSRFAARETGQALVMVLIFFLMGSLTLLPVMSHISTALKSGVVYENKTNELYAADAGIENSMWRIKYDFMGPSYDPYDYTTVWSYDTDPVNGLTADITIENVWLPSDAEPPTPALGRAIIESEKLVTTGSCASPGQPYYISFDFTPDTGDNLTVKSVGIWLPQGFSYDPGSCTLEDFGEDYYAVGEVSEAPGGTTVVWSYNPPDYPLFTDFPGVVSGNFTMTSTISFDYSPPSDNPDELPAAIAWVTCEMHDADGNPVLDPGSSENVPISWDTDTRIYKITSSAGDTHIEAYSTKCQLRQLGDAIAGDYVAIGNSLMLDNDWPYDKRDTLLSSSDTTVSSIPEDADVISAILYWSGFLHATALFSDTCSNFNNWDRDSQGESQVRVPTSDGDTSGTWNTSPRWDDIDETTANDTDYMTGTTSDSYQLFTFSAFSIPEDSPISDLTVYIRARDVGSPDNNDIRPAIKVNGTRYRTTASSNNPGANFTTYSYSFTTNPDTGLVWTAADINGTGDNPLQQFGVYSSDLNPDAEVSMVYAQVNVGCWAFSSGQFRGHGAASATTAHRTLTLKNSFDLSSYIPGEVAVCWEQDEGGTLEWDDTMYFAFSGDGGISWSSNIEAYSDDDPDSPFSYIVPDEYVTATFKIRFYFDFDDSTEFTYLDNIKFLNLPPDKSVTFEINDQQVYLDEYGDPQAGSGNLTASSSSMLVNTAGTSSDGFSYACYLDVTDLVQTYPVVPGEEHHTGNAEYSVGDVDADTGEYVSYAGWSLIIIYGSPETAGHYLYLRDVFAFNPGSTNLDFDNDGQPGGDITGFTIPDPIKDKYGVITETIAARITCFVGEGDSNYTGDTLEITGETSGLSEYLSNSASPSTNIWNSESPDMSYPGVDVDTFEVLWADGILTPDDTTLHLDMDSGTDAWNLIYFILSVRSETVTGGTEHYLISSY